MASVEETLRGASVSLFSVQDGQGSQGFEIGPLAVCLPLERQGLVVTPERPQDAGALCLHSVSTHAKPLCLVEITERIGETMKPSPCPGSCEERQPVRWGIVHKLLGQFCGAFGIGDPSQNV